jgi:hypothetical protein
MFNLPKEEKGLVAEFIDGAMISSVLLNDLLSFAREFEDHNRSGTLQCLHNAMFVLMGSYGYSENESIRILQEEIRAGEMAAMEKYTAWEASPAPKSEELRRYVALSILSHGGFCYWQMHSLRYNGPLTTTAEDRAQLVEKDPTKLRKLDGYPPPAALAGLNHLPQHSLLPPGGQHINGLHGANGDMQKQASNSAQRVNFFAPFKKASALDVCTFFIPAIQDSRGRQARRRTWQSKRLCADPVFRFACHHINTRNHQGGRGHFPDLQMLCKLGFRYPRILSPL